MVIADQYLSLSVGPPAGKPAKSFFLGAGGDICNACCLGFDWNFPRLPSQAIFSRESPADDTLSIASVAAICDGAATVACRGDSTSTTVHHSRHDIPGSTTERPSSRQSATSHSSSWTAEITATPSSYSTRWIEYLRKALKFSQFTKDPKEEERESQHHQYDGIVRIALQKLKEGQEPLQSDQKLQNAPVKGIYAGLVMVENKCIEVDKAQILRNGPRFGLNNNEIQNPVTLHSTLLHEHHDFFLAS
ncbi:hypothetical protein V8C37DRAFT_93763 [Trichoderma ceciliae]